jgi:hypothetical protein
MKSKIVQFCIVAIAAPLLTTSPRLLAQSKEPAKDERKTSEDDDTLILTPFVVESEQLGGYEATSTLAGTRVRTDLKDVASAITVVTKQFLKDTAVTNNQELLVYTPSTEVGGIGGNFTGIAGQTVPNESTKLANPGNNNRVRGLDTADNTRDYFLTDIPWDSFNTGRIDLQRGPNSILFGVGSPAGIFNASINDAGYKRSYRLENIVDQYGTLRNSLDVNHDLIKDRLALRISYLDDRRKFQQEPAFNDTERLYAALRVDPKLFGADNRTTLRIKYEDGSVNSNNPRTIPPNDRITPWFDVPYSKATINTYLPGSGSLASNNPTVSLFKPGGQLVFQGLASTVDVRSWFNGASAAGVPPPFSNNPTTVMVGMINAGIPGLNNQAYRPFAVAPYSVIARATKPGGSFYKDRVLTDSTVFNFFDNLLDGPNKQEWQDWDALNIDLQQSFFKNRLALDFTYDKQNYLTGQVNWLAGSDYGIGIEVNETFPDGSANPNVGRPYVTGTDAFGNSSFKSNREGKRGIVTVDLDAKDYLGDSRVGRFLGRFLGRNVLTGLAAVDTRDTKQVNWAQHATTPQLVDLLGLDAQAYGNIVGTRQFDWLYYTGPSLRTATNARGANVSRILSVLTPANSTTVRYFNPTWNKTEDPTQPGYVNRSAPFSYFNNSISIPGPAVGTQSDNPANYVGWTNGGVTWLSAANPANFASLVTAGRKESFKDESRGFTWQGYLLGGDLVPTFGWRKDTVTNSAAAARLNSTTGIAPLEYDLDPATTRQTTGQSRNWSGVYHLPEKLISKLPGHSKLSVFYNDSSNFKADAPRRNLIGGVIDNPRGKTREKGFVISTLDDRVTLRANWFETRVANATLAAGGGAIFGPNAFQLHRLQTMGLIDASIVQDAMNGNGGFLGDAFLAPAGWTNYAFADGVPGVGVTDNLTNTSATSAYQTAQQTINMRKMITAWLNMPAFMNKAYYQFWNTQISIDPSLAKASGVLRNAFGAAVGATDATSSFFNALLPSLGIPSVLPVSTVDTFAKGQEFEVFMRLKKNWNASLNYVRIQATRDNVDGATIVAMNAMNAFYSGDAGFVRQFGQTSPSFLVKNIWQNDLWLPYQVLLSSQGQSAPEVAKWRLNGVTTYTFDHGRLKGFVIGGAARLEAGRISGYRYSATLGYLDVKQPLMTKSDQHFDAWVGYSKKLTKHNLLWHIQLNVRNVGEDTRLVPAFYQPDGSLALARIQDGMAWRLTNSLEF